VPLIFAIKSTTTAHLAEDSGCRLPPFIIKELNRKACDNAEVAPFIPPIPPVGLPVLGGW